MPDRFLKATFVVLSMVMGVSSLARAEGRIFPVAEFGALPDDEKNDREGIQAAIAAAIQAGPGSTVRFDPGVYRVDLSEKELAEKPVDTKKPFNKRNFTYFDLKGADRLHLQGDRTELLVLDPRSMLFNFQGSDSCRLTGITIDLDPLPFTQGNIVAVNHAEQTFDIEIPPGFPLLGAYPWLTFGPQEEWQNRLLIFGKIDSAKTDRSRRDLTQFVYEFRPRFETVRDHLSFESTGPRTFRITSKVPLDKAVAPGNILVYSSKVGGGPLIDAGGRNLSMEDVTVHAAGGFVVSASSADNLQLRRFATRLKPDRLVVGTSDGVHTRATRGGPQVEDSLFEGIQDDIFNISGNPLEIKSIISGKEILIGAGTNSFNRGRVAVGDTVYAYSYPEARLRGEARVLELDQPQGSKKPKRLVLDQAIPGLQESDLLYSWQYGNQGTLLRRNTFRGGLRSAVMHMAGDGTVIEENLFDNMRNAIAVRQSVDSTRNGQGGMVRNLTIRNNEFRACHWMGVEHQNHPDAVIGIMLYPDSDSNQLENVLIEGNKIIEPGLYGIWLSNVNGAVLRNNEVVAYEDSEAPGVANPQRRSLRIHHSQNILVDGLKVTEPRADMAAAIGVDNLSENVELKNLQIDILHGEKVRKKDNIPPLKPVSR